MTGSTGAALALTGVISFWVLMFEVLPKWSQQKLDNYLPFWGATFDSSTVFLPLGAGVGDFDLTGLLEEDYFLVAATGAGWKRASFLFEVAAFAGIVLKLGEFYFNSNQL